MPMRITNPHLEQVLHAAEADPVVADSSYGTKECCDPLVFRIATAGYRWHAIIAVARALRHSSEGAG